MVVAMQQDNWNLDASSYRCLECGTLFTTEALIEMHIQKNHSPNTPYQCPHCGKVYKDNWHLNRHVQSHVMPGGFEPKIMCMQCKQVFKDSSLLAKHQVDGCESEEVSEAKEAESASHSLPMLKPGPSTEHLVISEWNEEYLPKPLTPMPRLQRTAVIPARYSCTNIVGIEYYCKICGDILPRLKFCSHIASHFPDIYLPRTEDAPRQISNDFIHQTGVPLGRSTAGCRSCTVSNSIMQKMKQTLEGLADGFAQRMAND